MYCMALSLPSGMERYNQRCDKIIERELKSIPRACALRVFRRLSNVVKNIPKIRGVWQRVALKKPLPSGRARLAARGRRSGEQVGHSRNSVAA